MSSETGALFTVRGIRKRYVSGRRSIEVLRGIDLEVARGEILAVAGHSGAGKSTLLHIMGLLDSPDSGELFFEGDELLAMPEDERARVRNRRLGFVFQFYHLFPEFSAFENVLMPARVYCGKGRGLAASRARAWELLDAVGLADRAWHRPAELSGGEQQRVAIARALINAPGLVLADEPSGNLDMETSREIHRLIDSLNRETGQTFVIVTHDREIAARAHRALQLKTGQIQADPGREGGGISTIPG